MKTEQTALNDTADMEESDLSMSNFDHVIDEGLADALKAKPGLLKADYAGWNFHGSVYFFAEKFHCEVWVYGSVRETISANTIEEIMEKVCDKYGSA